MFLQVLTALIDIFNYGQKIHVSAQAYGDSQHLTEAFRTLRQYFELSLHNFLSLLFQMTIHPPLYNYLWNCVIKYVKTQSDGRHYLQVHRNWTFKSQWFLYLPLTLTKNNFIFCPQIGVSYDSHSNNWLTIIFNSRAASLVIETQCIFCELLLAEFQGSED